MVFSKHIYGSESDAPSNPYLSKIISLWKYEGNANDSVGSNNGTATDVSYPSGLIGDCSDYNTGTGSKIVIPNDVSLSFGNGMDNVPWSFSTLVYFDTVANAMFINKRTTSNTNVEYQFLLNGSNLQFNIFNPAELSTVATHSFSPSADTWYHLGYSYNGETSVKIVIDGTVHTKTITKRIMNNLASEVVLGKHNFNTTFSLQGKLDETKLWNVVLSDAEWLDIASKELSGINILE